MGYYSHFTIEIDGVEEPEEGWEEILRDVSGGYYFEYWNGSYITDDVKWYGSESDLIRLSERFPEAIITVERRTEDGEADAKYTLKAGKFGKRYVRDWVEFEEG